MNYCSYFLMFCITHHMLFWWTFPCSVEEIEMSIDIHLEGNVCTPCLKPYKNSALFTSAIHWIERNI